MVDRQGLVGVLGGLVSVLESDLRGRAESVAEVGGLVEGEWVGARDAGRTELGLEVWREGLFTQVAVGWVLASVFVRFCEDNGLIPNPVLSGRGDRRRRAEDGQTLFFREHPAEGERGFLTDVFRRMADLPGLSGVLGSHSPIWLFGPTNDGCAALLDLWRKVNPDSGELVWDFTNPSWDTRFLGDLYQDLSESARKTYALLQTPDFVEEFILDRTLDPALDEFGLEGFRMIDPACGSGHFLLGSFQRLFARWQQRSPELGDRALAEKALQSVFGVDLNPFAVAIARFRLLVAALKAAAIPTLAEAPIFTLNVATGDSLLHGPPPRQQTFRKIEEEDPATRHLFATEDGEQVTKILTQRYHAVVANPPYITPKDPAANAAYRRRYFTTHMKYALTVPFMERLFDLAIRGGPNQPAGYVGQITANSFMKREFGKKVIEQFLATQIDLTHVIDTSGAYIPGHGTPTVILLGRNQSPSHAPVRAALSIRGEPSKPADPAKGLVWTSITNLIDTPGSENEYISVDNLDRSRLKTHPWSLQGGGAIDLLRLMTGTSSLAEVIQSIGFHVITGEDAVFLDWTRKSLERLRQTDENIRNYVSGERVRDWRIDADSYALFPYGPNLVPTANDGVVELLWRWRTGLRLGLMFGETREQRGLAWWEYVNLSPTRDASRLLIAYASVATHNHFVLNRGAKVFKQSAPVIILSSSATVEDHLELLGPLNSSIGCFWMKQVFHNKGSTVDSEGARQTTVPFENYYDLDGTKLKRFPLPAGSAQNWAAALDAHSQSLEKALPTRIATDATPSPEAFREARSETGHLRRQMVAIQEELDWRCYFLYGLTSEDLSLLPEATPAISKGQRAFEIDLARRAKAGEAETTWFTRHGSKPTTDIPKEWPHEYQGLVERRLALIRSDQFVSLLERPEYKRRWNWEDWGALETAALQSWLLDRLEIQELSAQPHIRSVGQLSDTLRIDPDFMQVAGLYVKSPEFELEGLINELVTNEAVPFLAAWRYSHTGLRKYALWERTWVLQRREDAGEDVGKIPVPPRYQQADFVSKASWALRGKLDVPKERFISYPGLNRDTDATLLIGWAGWDHLQQAKALAGWYEQRRTVDGWDTDRLIPILAGIAELVPWIKQWHNDPDPATGQRLGDFFDDFITTECQTHRVPRTALTEWRPPTTKKRQARTSA